MDLALVTKSVSSTIHKNSPQILTALGVGGLLTTMILTVKATIQAKDIYDNEVIFRRADKAYKGLDPLIEPKEVIALTWQSYIPPVIMGLTTAVCIVGANSINLKRSAALASIYSFTETALREYQSKVVETIGEKKESDIREAIVQDKLNANPVNDRSVVITGKGDYLCYDTYSSRYFRSTVEHLQRCEIAFNQQLLRDGWVGINEFYYEIGLEPIPTGDKIGWIGTQALMELKFTSKLATNDEPCLAIDFYVQPRDI